MKPIKSYNYYLNYKFRFLPYFRTQELRWKDKWNSPRCEIVPSFTFEWLWFGLYISNGTDDWWEQKLWLTEYCNNDLQKAKETWGWIDYDTKESTWKDYKFNT